MPFRLTAHVSSGQLCACRQRRRKVCTARTGTQDEASSRAKFGRLPTSKMWVREEGPPWRQACRIVRKETKIADVKGETSLKEGKVNSEDAAETQRRKRPESRRPLVTSESRFGRAKGTAVGLRREWEVTSADSVDCTFFPEAVLVTRREEEVTTVRQASKVLSWLS